MKTLPPIFQRLAWGAGVGLVATFAYRSIQTLAADRAEIRNTCWTWRWLPFEPAWIFPYGSMFLLIGLPWFFLPDLRQVRRFAGCLLLIAFTGWILFLLHPTACARPSADGQPRYYAALLRLDQPNNCLPCLHSAFSVLAVWVLVQTRGFFGRMPGRVLLGAWLLVIGVSIVGLRQHTDVDTLAGAALGCAGGGLWNFLAARSRVADVN